MIVRYTPRAAADREEIFDFLRLRSPIGARNVMARIQRTLDLLAFQPLAGHSTSVAGIRVIAVPKYPFRIFYRVESNTVELVHIRHVARRQSGLE